MQIDIAKTAQPYHAQLETVLQKLEWHTEGYVSELHGKPNNITNLQNVLKVTSCQSFHLGGIVCELANHTITKCWNLTKSNVRLRSRQLISNEQLSVQTPRTCRRGSQLAEHLQEGHEEASTDA